LLGEWCSGFLLKEGLTNMGAKCKLHKMLRTPMFKQRVVKDKKKEEKKQGHKEEQDEQD